MRYLIAAYVAASMVVMSAQCLTLVEIRQAQAVVPVGAAKPADEPGRKADIGTVTAQQITLVDEDGKTCLTLSARKGCSGLWIVDPKDTRNQFTAHWSKDYGLAFGLYSAGVDNGMSLAFSPDPKGVNVQYADKEGKLQWAPFHSFAPPK